MVFIRSWGGRILLAVLVTVVAVVVVNLLRRLLSGLAKRIEGFVQKHQKEGPHTTALLMQEVVLRAALLMVRLLRIVATLSITYLWATGVAYFVDPTHELVNRLVDPVKDAAISLGTTLLSVLPNLLILGLIAFVTRLVIDGVSAVAQAVDAGTIKLSWLPEELVVPTKRLAIFGVLIVALVLALPYIPGSDSKTFQGLSIVLGILVSFGSSSVVANVMAGLVLTYSRAFRLGDRVKIGDFVGDVAHLGVFAIRLRTLKNEEVVIPNAVVQNAPWTNFASYTRSKADPGVQLSTQVTIGYDVPWRVVHRLLLEAAQGTEGVDLDHEPYVLQKSLDDFYVRYEIFAFCRRPRDLHFVQGRLCQHIQDSFFRQGVEICSPHFRNHRQADKPAIPADPSGPPPECPLPGEGPRATRISVSG